MTRYLSVAVFLGGFVALSGCASNIRLVIDSIPQANGGKPVHVMVRAGKYDDLVPRSYESEANRMFSTREDTSVRSREVIIPGQRHVVVLKDDEESAVGLYVFFTNYEEPWSVRFGREALPGEIFIVLKENKLTVIGRR